MVCRHIKVNEIYNFILHADTIEKVKLEYTKISNADTSFELLDGNLTEIDNNLYIKEISFSRSWWVYGKSYYRWCYRIWKI